MENEAKLTNPVRSEDNGYPWEGNGNKKRDPRMPWEYLECSVSCHKWVQFVKNL